MIAFFTVFVYDFLLTLEDEVMSFNPLGSIGLLIYSPLRRV